MPHEYEYLCRVCRTNREPIIKNDKGIFHIVNGIRLILLKCRHWTSVNNLSLYNGID